MTENQRLTVVCGGQFGSEGKGQVCGELAPSFSVLVRSGSINSGHTVRWRGKKRVFKQLPAGAFTNPKATVIIAPGALLHLPTFVEEMKQIEDPRRVFVDRNAFILTKTDQDVAANTGTTERYGSTAKGCGAAMLRRINRAPGAETAADREAEIRQTWATVTDTAALLQEAVWNLSESILVEGTQGVLLDLVHGPPPFTTHRMTTPGALLSECGLPTTVPHSVISVHRTFPIRVAGNSGPLPNELTWGQAGQNPARTTVTNKIRRVGAWSWPNFQRSNRLSGVTEIALTFLDYLPEHKQQGFIEKVRAYSPAPITIFGYGPESYRVLRA